jgi:adenosylcobinamide-GDP ribazoletransferase
VSKVIDDFFSLLCFFTSIPIPKHLCKSSEFSSLYLIPLIGFIKGVIIALPIAILRILNFDIFITTSIVLILHFTVQGFLHADGFIDFSEALLAHRLGIDPYMVIKDKYKGSYAIAVFVVFVLFLYTSLYGLLNKLTPLNSFIYIVLSETWSLTSVLILSYFSSTSLKGLGREFKEGIDFHDVIIGLIIIFTINVTTFTLITPIKGLIGGIYSFISSLIPIVFSVMFSHTLSVKTLGFITGDVLGFTIELTYALVVVTYFILV